jgi:predicted NAD/FAD-binding protein
MRLGIIGGGGAGLASAWLLEAEHDVTLYEKEDRLGGHAHTIPIVIAGQTAYLDAGFEFFSEVMFPTYTRLLRLLNAPLRPYPATVTFYTTDQRQVMILPPNRDGHLYWPGLAPGPLANMLRLAYLLWSARKVMQRRDTTLSLQQFVDTVPFLGRRFKNEFLYPFLLAQWCVEPDEFRQFMAYNALRYSYLHQRLSLRPPQMLDLEGGMQVYIRLLQQALQRTRVRLATAVLTIQRTSQGYQVQASDGSLQIYDGLVMSTNAQVARHLLAGVEGMAEASYQLGRVAYFPTTIALHSDTRLMPTRPEHWSVVNIRYDGTHAQNSVWKPWRHPAGKPIFKSWVTYEQELPEPLYATATFMHPKINRDYFEAQRVVQNLQGQQGIWFAGVHTYDVDCHESVILSAVQVGRQLSPDSPRLRQLLDK